MRLINSTITDSSRMLAFVNDTTMINLYHSTKYNYSSISIHNENGYIFKSNDIEGSLLKGIKLANKILNEINS